MHYLVLDTCVWIELGVRLPGVLEKITALVDQARVQILLPQIVIDEWDRLKHSKVVAPLRQSICDRIKKAKELGQYLGPSDAQQLSTLIDRLHQNGGIQDTWPVQRIRGIEDLFYHPSTRVLFVTDGARIQAAEIALAKKPPFGEKNSMADALIMLSVLDYVGRNNLSGCLFVTTNTRDFASPSDRRRIHEDLEELFRALGVRFFANVGEAVNNIESYLVSDETIASIDLDLNLREHIKSLERYQEMVDALAGSMPSTLIDGVLESLDRYQEMADALTKSVPFAPIDGLLKSLDRYQQMVDALAESANGHDPSSSDGPRGMGEEHNGEPGEDGAPAVEELTMESPGVAFAVYVNYPNDRITIHTMACGCYNNRIGDETKNGHWAAQFQCLADARDYALSQEKSMIRCWCRCLPEYRDCSWTTG